MWGLVCPTAGISLRFSISRGKVSDGHLVHRKDLANSDRRRAFRATGSDSTACSATLRTGAGLAVDCARQLCAHTSRTDEADVGLKTGGRVGVIRFFFFALVSPSVTVIIS